MPNSRSLLVAEKALWYSQTVTILMLHLDHLHLSRHCSVNVIYLGLLAVISCWPLQSSSINKLWPDNNYKTKDEPKLSSSGKKKRKKIKLYLYTIIVVAFTCLFHILNVTIIMGQRQYCYYFECLSACSPSWCYFMTA